MTDTLAQARELLGAEALARFEHVGPVDALVGIPSLNQGRSLAQTLIQATRGADRYAAKRKVMVLAVDAGSRDDTPDTIRGWLSSPPSRPTREGIRLPGPPERGRAILAILAAARLLEADVCGLVDADLIGLTAEGVAALLGPVLDGEGDFVSPAYTRSISEGTLTTTLLAPLTRALYGRRIQQVIGGCAGLAKGLIGRLLEEGPPRDASDGCGIEVWLPTGALAAAGRIVEVHLGRKVVAPALAQPDLATTLARVVGPTFALMDRYAGFWAGVRGSAPVPAAGERAGLAPETGELHLDRMVRAFRLGVKDLLPVWEQILPDETLGALFPLEIIPVEEFAFPPRLWARVVCDFAVAHHERRVARDHLLRALTPLYLGRAAAFLREAQMGPLDHVPTLWEETGRAFEAEADILRNRWR